MNTVEVKTTSGYRVQIGPGLLGKCGRYILSVHTPCPLVLVTDQHVDSLYASQVTSCLERSGFQVRKFVLPSGEGAKTLENYGHLLQFLAQVGLTRSDLIVTLGGGVVGDLGGFAAATYQRGTAFIQLPTTLLAQVDASVGGKTAVDLPQGKNLAGAFWQPKLVLCDTQCLNSLPRDVWADGAAEAVKSAMIADAGLLEDIAQGALETQPEMVITRCVQIKAAAVEKDEQDHGERQKLNFGHTAAHGIERWSGYSIPHGRAVAIGMAVITRACVQRGLASETVWQALKKALDRLDLPKDCPAPARELAEAAAVDKKRQGGQVTLVLPERIGECRLVPTDLAALEQFFQDGF
ncbi:3-dehydroquinate synthase [Hominifimenecus sp. rT4P-3]|uniref:3-dehydroquinate synthase n=1 Tax=Hominifimenecus sp. rT4P-3 TaxID=3242979 RepID=UPI003DA67A21